MKTQKYIAIFTITFILLFSLALFSNAQTVDNAQPVDEIKLLENFYKNALKKEAKLSKGFKEFRQEKADNLKVETVIIRYPKWMGGTSIGYKKTNEEAREQLREALLLSNTSVTFGGTLRDQQDANQQFNRSG